MNSSLSQKLTSRIKWLGVYQIAGGLVGVALVFWAILSNLQASGFLIALYLLMVSFFAFSIYCGMLCIKTSSHALRFSLVNQILQIIGFAAFGYAFKYVAGFYFNVGIDLTESFSFTFGAGVSAISINLNSEVERLAIDFNFIALILVVFIEGLKKSVREEQNKTLISSLAEDKSLPV